MNPPPDNPGEPLTAQQRLSLARVPDADVDATIGAWLPRWTSTARTIAEYGEEGLVAGLAEEQAAAVLLLARQVRHLATLQAPLLVQDDSFPPDPRGYPAFSYDKGHQGLRHPVPVGMVVRTRDMNEDPSEEWLARVTAVEAGVPVLGVLSSWVYRLLPA